MVVARTISTTLLAALLQFLTACVHGAGFTWIPSSDPLVAGYKIYYGPSSHNYTSVAIEGNVTNATLTGLAPGATYFFAATSFDADGNESDYSNEATYTVPDDRPSLTLPAQAPGEFGFTVSGITDAEYIVQGSTNLVDWISLETNISPFNFVDAEAGNFPQRFYRTVSPQ